MSKSRVTVLALIAAVILAAGALVGFKLVRDQGYADALCDQIKTKRATYGTVEQVTTGATTVAVLGDSYSAGFGIPSMKQSWEYTLGTSKGWSMNVAAVSSSGLLNPGACGDAQFSGRVAAIKATRPDLLIVQDGLNDLEYPAADVERAAADLLDEFGDIKQIVVVGPNTIPDKQHLAEIDAALKSAAESAGAQYVSTLGWDLELMPDGHMTEKGHQQYAALLSKSL